MNKALGVAAAGLLALSFFSHNSSNTEEELLRTIEADRDRFQIEKDRLVEISESLERQLSETVNAMNVSQQRCDALESANRELERQNRALEDVNIKLTNAAQALSDEKLQLDTQNKTLKQKLSSVNSSMQTLTQERVLWEQEIGNLACVINTLRARLDSEINNVSKLTAKLLTAEANLNDAKANYKKQIADAMKEKNELLKVRSAESSANADESRRLSDENANLLREIEKLHANAIESTRSFEEAKREISSQKEYVTLENQSLKSQLAASEATAQNLYSKSQRELQAKNKENEELRAYIATLACELRRVAKLNDEQINEMHRLKQEIARKTDRCESADREIQNLNLKNATSCEEVTRLYSEAQTAINAKRAIEHQLTLQSTAASLDIAMLHQSVKTLTNANQSLTETIETLQNSTVSQDEFDTLKKTTSEQLASLTFELAINMQLVYDLQQEAERQKLTTISLQIHNETKESLAKQITELENNLATVIGEREKRTQQNRKLEQAIVDLKEPLRKLEQWKLEAETCAKRIAELRQAYKLKKASLVEAENGLKSKEERLEIVETECVSRKAKLEESEKVRIQHSERIRSLIAKLERTTRENSLLKLNFDVKTIWECVQEEINREKNTLNQKIEDISQYANSYYQFVMSKLTSEPIRLATERDEIAKKLIESEEDRKKITEVNERFQTDLSEQKCCIDILTRKNKELTKIIEEYKKYLAESRKKHEDLKKSNSALTETRKHMKLNLQQTQKKNEELQTSLESLKSELESERGNFESEKDILQTTIAELEKSQEEWRKSNAFFRRQLDETKSALEAKEKQSFRLETEMGRLKSEHHALNLKHEVMTECAMCLETEKSIVLVPCMHFCVCETCSLKKDFCPICKEDVVERMRIFP